jgi:hypothetical protein
MVTGKRARQPVTSGTLDAAFVQAPVLYRVDFGGQSWLLYDGPSGLTTLTSKIA